MGPRWTRGAKDAAGTAYSTESKVWYTLAAGCVTEVYYPTIDSPQIRDLQFLATDGETFFHDGRRGFAHEIACVDHSALGFELTNKANGQPYTLHETVIGDPHLNCLLVHTRVEGDAELLKRLKLYVLCAPHLEIGGWHNNGEVMEIKGRRILVAYKGNTWLAMCATAPFLRCSAGYVGVNDGWTDLADNYRMDYEYDAALDGNIALTGEIDLSREKEFTLGLAFGNSLHNAISTLLQSLSIAFEHSLGIFIDQWHRTAKRFSLAENLKCRDSKLFELSVNLLLAHEDKSYPGALIAAMSIPWGNSKDDSDLGGYHLVWTRDMVSSADALLAVGDLQTPLRALIYLDVTQREDGGFYQNFWIDGNAYWQGVQLDEVSFPVILAWRLHQNKALANFDPYPMVLRACSYLLQEGPATPQDRWEEAAGYSPNSLAVNIAGLICSAEVLDARGEKETAEFVREYADFLESHIEEWTVTTQGTLVPGITRHYIRMTPANAADSSGDEDPNTSVVTLANQPPDRPAQHPAKEIVDAGFLHLVRYGIRSPHDPLIVDSLKVIDAVLKVDTPGGACWKRYNYDGYGQRDDGGPFKVWGTGRMWPLLAGERGHYELAAGRDPRPYLEAMEHFAHGVGLVPEQVWDEEKSENPLLHLGGPTGAAIPLMWGHSEYVKLLRSYADNQVFDLLEPVRDRYLGKSIARERLEVWKASRKVRWIPAGSKLRVMASCPFTLHWSADEWAHVNDTASTATALSIHYVDIATATNMDGTLRFTFLWTDEQRWEGTDYAVECSTTKTNRER